jgi:hypothetical protein
MKELLLLLSGYPFDETYRETLSRLISEVTDWKKLVEVINAHGIIALAAYNIKESGLEQKVPLEAMQIIRNGFRQSQVRNLWLTENWKEVNTILCNAGIKHILLKGMALEYTIYEGRGLRQMNDTDILIQKKDSVKAWHLLTQAGYAPKPLKSPLFRKFIFNFGQHLPALYKNGYAIEIHTRLFNEGSYEDVAKDPFNETIEITINGITANILSRKTHLKYLKQHLERHTHSGECQLRLYSDIALLENTKISGFPDQFISDPLQSSRPVFLRAAYKANIRSLPLKYRFRFIIGDMFPSLSWMKERYKSKGIKVFLFYPPRLSKLLWLI